MKLLKKFSASILAAVMIASCCAPVFAESVSGAPAGDTDVSAEITADETGGTEAAARADISAGTENVDGGENKGPESSDYIMSEWAKTEVGEVIALGVDFSRLPRDFTSDITRAQFCDLAVQIYEINMKKTGNAEDNAEAVKGTPPEKEAPTVYNPSDTGSRPEDGTAYLTANAAEGGMLQNGDKNGSGVIINNKNNGGPSNGSGEITSDGNDSAIEDGGSGENNYFSDTDDEYVLKAAALGIVNGYTDGTFKPDSHITRNEAAVILKRVLNIFGKNVPNSMPARYNDSYLMPEWAKESIKFVSGQKDTSGRQVMGGYNNCFMPSGFYSIEQSAATLMRIYTSADIETECSDWKKAPGYNVAEIKFTAGGDCTFGRHADSGYNGSFDEMYDIVKDPSYFFKNISQFKNDDISMVNFEGTLTDRGTRADKKFVFRGRAEYANILKAGSIEAVSISNNHTYDYGTVGYNDTIANLKGHVAISGGNLIPIIEKNGVKVGLVSSKCWAFGSAEKKFITDSIANLKSRGADIIIFTYHWGEERKYSSNSTQQAIARYCIDQGADLVIGNHPHVVQEVETYKGCQIAYSLGNLVFGGNKNPSDKNCMIFSQRFLYDKDQKKIISRSYEAHPYRVSSVNYRNDYQPVPVR